MRQNQFALFLLYVAQRRYDFLTKILPHCWIRLLFNYLSNRYTVSITKLADDCPRTNQSDIGVTLWGGTVCDVVYFTPPQSNISKLDVGMTWKVVSMIDRWIWLTRNFWFFTQVFRWHSNDSGSTLDWLLWLMQWFVHSTINSLKVGLKTYKICCCSLVFFQFFFKPIKCFSRKMSGRIIS